MYLYLITIDIIIKLHLYTYIYQFFVFFSLLINFIQYSIVYILILTANIMWSD